MNLRYLTYYTLDHPFKKGEKVLYSNRRKALETVSQIYELKKNPERETPRIFRIHISGDSENEDKATEKVRLYEEKRLHKERQDFNKAKAKEILRFARALIIGYLLFLAPEGFWSPIVSLFNLIAHGLSDYARWCVIIFAPLKGFIRTFGTLFYIRGKVNLGIPGNWHRIHESARILKTYKDFDESPREDLQKAREDFLKNLEEKAGSDESAKALSAEIKSYLEKEQYRDISHWLRKGEENDLWGEMINFKSLEEERLFQKDKGTDKLSPLFHFPDGSGDNLLNYPAAAISAESFKRQSEHLKKFNGSQKVLTRKGQILTDWTKLNQCQSNKDRITLLQSLCNGLEVLRDEMSRFHMGKNLLIPNDKTNDPALFYHYIFTMCGEALCELEKGYRRAAVGIVPLKSNRAGKKRIKRLNAQLSLFLNGSYEKRKDNLKRTLAVSWGKSPVRGLALSALIVFAVGSLFSFYSLRPGDTLILNRLKVGYNRSFLSREITLQESSTPLIGWHLPRPIASHSIINGRMEQITVYMIMGEYKSENPLSKVLTALSGQLGTRFEIIEMTIQYSPDNTELWSRYNKDGKGDRRLLRDLSEIAEEWRTVRGNELSVLSNKDFDLYYRELARSGVLEEFLKRSFSQTTFSTNIYYGSLSERFDTGINAVLSEFDRTVEEKRADIHWDEADVLALEEDLTMASEIVKNLKEEIEEQVQLEYDLLRGDPDLLNSLVNDPYGKAQKIKEFETLWINLSNYIQYLYRQKELIQILSEGFIDMDLKDEALKLYPMHLNLIEHLQENDLIKELIDIKTIRFNHRIIGLTEFTQYQEKWKDTI